MAIDANSKTMLDPTRDGKNFGIAFSPDDYPTNTKQCMESCNTSTQIDKLVGKVSYKGANQSQLPSLANGGASLGRPGTGTGE
jgi:hypothetical protein